MTIPSPERLKMCGPFADQLRRGKLCPGFETRTFRPNRASMDGEPAHREGLGWRKHGRKYLPGACYEY